jgi:hypothetical protein
MYLSLPHLARASYSGLILILVVLLACCVDVCPGPRSTYLFVFSYVERVKIVL